MGQYAAIIGWGMAVPERIMTNHELATIVDTSDEWIRTRTGIQQRHVAGAGETTATLGTAAALQALHNAGLGADDIELVICATTSPDHLFPSTACLIQHAIGARRAAAFDVAAACSGFVYGLTVATQFIRAGSARRVLVLGADTLTRFLDWTDRSTCVLFGDGAGAVVLEASGTPAGLLDVELGSDGSGAELLMIPAGGSRQPLTPANVGTAAQFIQMAGREVYRFGVRVMVESTGAVLRKAGLTVADLDLFVPHQANLRIIQSAVDQLGLLPSQVMTNVDRYGNTSAASIPIALCEASHTGRLKPGDSVAICGMGGGLTWGAGLVRWTHNAVNSNGLAALPIGQPVLVSE